MQHANVPGESRLSRALTRASRVELPAVDASTCNYLAFSGNPARRDAGRQAVG